jgi:type III pantothenate kinase
MVKWAEETWLVAGVQGQGFGLGRIGEEVEGSLSRVRVIHREELEPFVQGPFHEGVEVGMDRLLLVAGISTLVSESCLALDFGTFTTVNAVSAQGQWRGGWILPGYHHWMESAEARAPQLVAKPSDWDEEWKTRWDLPFTTSQALSRGFQQCLGTVLQELRNQYPMWFVTGGDRERYRPWFSREDRIDAHWVERGMREVAGG